MIFSPRRLLLIDGLGAILSAFMLGIVLVKLESMFGIPPSTLYFLAILPVFFALFDFYCYQRKSNSLGRCLKMIAILNLLYCCLSVGIAFYHIETITIIGWLYILIEILIIITLAVFELKVAKRIAIKNNK
ncbi:hypothetical protein [uncultured Dokdonia sp.]|uniref:hypothetical protein n=1 Tax=uncultured Dokdonia sp. TaxID=575653 RepID=UPI002626FA35|nr:hypothetical protein [uncultured Dokdonia sp.]